mmetsp:Transcript_6619/g.16433  ORF Transcript_6619/g.16433 Transcript_6619/m.16433 type:complete len:202 (+) Transcript_6619:8549-9154(+)
MEHARAESRRRDYLAPHASDGGKRRRGVTHGNDVAESDAARRRHRCPHRHGAQPSSTPDVSTSIDAPYWFETNGRLQDSNGVVDHQDGAGGHATTSHDTVAKYGVAGWSAGPPKCETAARWRRRCRSRRPHAIKHAALGGERSVARGPHQQRDPADDARENFRTLGAASHIHGGELQRTGHGSSPRRRGPAGRRVERGKKR